MSQISSIFSNETLLQSFGAWLGFGAIGVGLAIVLLCAILVSVNVNSRNLIVFAIIGIIVVSFGYGIEFFRAREQALVNRNITNLQNYFGAGAWGDLADAISTKFKGSLYPVGNAVSKLLKKDVAYQYPVSIPGKDCRYIIAIAQPPADIRMQLEGAPSDLIRTETDERSFYRWTTICNDDAAQALLNYQVSAVDFDSMVRVSTFSDRATTPPANAAAPPANPPSPDPVALERSLTLAVCLGEFLGNCPGRSDIFLPCGSALDAGTAKNQCTLRGFKDGKLLQRISVGGNKCGYSIADIVCS
ncbi:hypothetical protein ELH70_14495 [Rhizobium ruizarguesonis]|uniref:hypothetical protein n=1 Tax=Rhizobium ruizarguesonis TaxID=2081791 RepID=UPI0010325FE2|nr:hypothetical protein [Rhizobium ruizarguesonis]TAZ73782.1 hypothetical protein ELH70_14495 [Rhizobium ruizarguesonis]TAZ86763.1 hypothetical protein ELH69_37730 [Rhizobium ruizarguesonis]